MTVTIENLYTGNGSTTDYSFTFPYLDTTDIKASLGGVVTTAYSLLNATTVRFSSAPGNGVAIRIYRDTAFTTPKATFYPGSAIRANDLNDNTLQNLYVNQESNEKVTKAWLTGDPTVISTESWHTSDDTKVATTKAIEGRIDSKIDTALTTDVVAGSSISIADDTPSSGKITLNVIAATGSNSGSLSASDKSKLDGIEASATADQTNAEIRAAVEAATDSNVFTDADHTKLNAIEASATADQTNAEIRTAVEAASDSNVFTDADHTKLNAIEASATADQTASEIKTLLQSDKLTSSEIATGALDGRYYTETESDARYFNISTGDTIKDGDAFPDNDTTIATTAAINDRIIDLVDDVGGFVPIANETSFPNANPDVNNGAGTLVSIKALGSNLTSNGSGVATISNGTVGNSTVTINGLANSTTYAATFGMIVETTSTLNTYTFHRLVPKATEVSTVSGSISNVNAVAGAISNVNTVAGNNTNINTVASANSNITTVAGNNANITTVAGNNTNINTVAGANSNISTVATNISNVNTVGGAISNVNTVATNISSVNDFAARYRVASSAPSSSLDTGDLYFDTTGNELKVYNGSAWQGGVTATGNLLAKSGDQMTGNLTFSGSQTVDGRDVSVDGAKLDGIATNANNYTHPNHSGEVTSSADGATVVVDNIIDEANLKVSNSPTNGQFLSAQSGNTGGLTWATPTSYTHPNHSGEVTSSADGAQTIASNVVDEDNLKISNSGSNGQFLSKQSGNNGGLTWADVDLTPYAPKASPTLTGTATGVNLTLSGNLTVNGTTTTVASTNTTISDNLLELNSGASSNANDAGILIERGSTGDNAIIAWDESADKFTVGTTTGTASSTGNISITTGTLVANVEGNGSNITNINAANLGSGTVPTARLGSGSASSSTVLRGNGTWGAPANLQTTTTSANSTYYIPFVPAWGAGGSHFYGDSGNSLTYNPSTNVLTSGSFSGSGANLTSLNASNLSSGTVPMARLGTAGTPSGGTCLRGDGYWATIDTTYIHQTNNAGNYHITFASGNGNQYLHKDDDGSFYYQLSNNRLYCGNYSGNGSQLTSLNASNIASGTIPDARFPSTLPAISGANLTNIEAGSTIQGTASGTLTANCAVMVKSDGTLEQPSEVTAASHTGGQIHSSSYAGPENGARLMYDSDNSRVIAVWTKGYDGGSSTQYKPFYSVGTISGSSISWGSIGDFSSASWTRTNSGFMHACYHPTAQKVVAIFQSAGTGHPSGSTQGRLYYVVGSISGSSISWGSSAAFPDTNTNLYWASNDNYASFEYDSFNNKLIFAYRDSSYYNKHSVCTVSTTANSATWGNVATVATRVNNYQKQSFNLTPLGDGRVILTYVERDLHGYGYYPGRLTVLNWNAATGYYNYGSDIVPYGGTGDRRFASCKCGFHKADDGTYTIFLGRRNSSNNYYYMQVGTLSGSGTSTSISWGSEHNVDTSIDWVYDVDYNSKSDKLITLYVENGNALKRREGTYSGTSITWDSVVSESIGSSQNSLNRAWHAPTQYKQMSAGGNPLGYYIIGWRNSNSTYSPSYWWARQMASTTRDAARYIGMAKQTYTNGQTATVNVIGNSTTGSSLTPNTTYYVDDDGTITSTATDTEIGKAYSSTKILLKK